jgi:hypothetical protein
MLFTNGPPKGKDEKSIVQLRAIFGKKKKKRCHTCLMDAANVLSSGGCASIDPETMPVLEIPGKSSLSLAPTQKTLLAPGCSAAREFLYGTMAA